MRVCIKPFGVVDASVLEFLQDKLAEIFGECEITLPLEVPSKAYNPMRRQYRSSSILESIEVAENQIVLGVIEDDIYTGHLNFVFGEAELNGSKAIISLRRLRPNEYGMKDGNLLRLRALKEAIHEIGHVLGLTHCSNPKCVMHFSNSVFDTDVKDWKYCDVCREKLEQRGIRVKL